MSTPGEDVTAIDWFGQGLTTLAHGQLGLAGNPHWPEQKKKKKVQEKERKIKKKTNKSKKLNYN